MLKIHTERQVSFQARWKQLSLCGAILLGSALIARADNAQDINIDGVTELNLAEPLDLNLQLELNTLDYGYALIGNPTTGNLGVAGAVGTKLRWSSRGSSRASLEEGIILNRAEMEGIARKIMIDKPIPQLEYSKVLLTVCQVAMAHERAHILQYDKGMLTPNSENGDGLWDEAQADVFAGAWFGSKLQGEWDAKDRNRTEPMTAAQIEQERVNINQRLILLLSIVLELGEETASTHPSLGQRTMLFSKGFGISLAGSLVNSPEAHYDKARLQRELGFRYGQEKVWDWSWRLAQQITGVAWQNGDNGTVQRVISTYVSALKTQPESLADNVERDTNYVSEYWSHVSLPGAIKSMFVVPKEPGENKSFRCLISSKKDLPAAQVVFNDWASRFPAALPAGWTEYNAPELTPDATALAAYGTWHDPDGKFQVALTILKHRATYEVVIEVEPV